MRGAYWGLEKSGKYVEEWGLGVGVSSAMDLQFGVDSGGNGEMDL